ncbi:MAG: site-2 protease family protein, partial [Candidatus Aureabacteria bacterium]|nr:site-2 protease family protein [Candidatus Auribacterota bacterium]
MMRTDELRLLALQLRVLLEDLMVVDETVVSRRGIVFRGALLSPPGQVFSALRERLRRFDLVPMLSHRRDVYELRVLSEVHPAPSNPLINLLLFALTVASTLFVGAAREGVNLIDHPHQFAAGIPFACSIIAILGVHEFGHYLMSIYHGVRATLPYFIPAPTIIGTLGAVIKTKSYIPDRKSLLDIGAAGPLCGFVAACAALAVGLYRSDVVDLGPLLRRTGVEEFGDSLIVYLMSFLIKGPLPEGKAIMLNPVGFAGWVGLLVTAFNLMPVGQLDGGHVLYSLVGRFHAVIARGT